MEGAVFWLFFGSAVIGSPFAHLGRVGPMTEQQCERAVAALGPEASCRRSIGAMTCGGSRAGYICPLFEGDISVPVGPR
jgi:hypothetical protein